MEPLKTVFEYDNYRAYLKDVYDSFKASKKGFSFRAFSKDAGFQSPNFLKLVINGQRNLSIASIEKFSKALKHTRDETTFFRNLVLFNQAATGEEKQSFAEELLRSKRFKKIHPLKESQFNYYSHWYFVPIRELVALKDFREDYDWIASRITPAVTAAEARKAVVELIKLGLLKRNAAGNLIQESLNVATPDEVTSSFVAQFHREMMKKAAESIDRHPRENREISSVTISVSRVSAERIKGLIQRFRKEVMDVAAQEPQPDRLYQLNFQLFPVAQPEAADDEEGTE